MGERGDKKSIMTGDRSNHPPTRTDKAGEPVGTSARAEVTEFLQRVRALSPATGSGRRGRLIFSLDATMSRQPTWDTACSLQADMFREAGSVGGVDIQLLYFRCMNE